MTREFIVTLIQTTQKTAEVKVLADSFDEARAVACETGLGPNDVWHFVPDEPKVHAADCFLLYDGEIIP